VCFVPISLGDNNIHVYPNAPSQNDIRQTTESYLEVLAAAIVQDASANALASFYLNSVAFCDTNSPMMRPNNPRTELKISMTRILTNLIGIVNTEEVGGEVIFLRLTNWDQQHLPVQPHSH
jgi:hypothetical protein